MEHQSTISMTELKFSKYGTGTHDQWVALSNWFFKLKTLFYFWKLPNAMATNHIVLMVKLMKHLELTELVCREASEQMRRQIGMAVKKQRPGQPAHTRPRENEASQKWFSWSHWHPWFTQQLQHLYRQCHLPSVRYQYGKICVLQCYYKKYLFTVILGLPHPQCQHEQQLIAVTMTEVSLQRTRRKPPIYFSFWQSKF